jgi:2-haloacid dehalogenase
MAGATVAFDMFGTLAEPFGPVETLRRHTAHPERLAASWRRHQLEVSWLLTVMERYEDWTAVTAYALDVALAEEGLDPPADARRELLGGAGTPRLFDDVPAALAALARAGSRLSVLSNGTPGALRTIVRTTGIEEHVAEIISVDEVRAYKPAPAVYRHAAERLGVPPERLWLVSANPFDCAGARAAGLRVAKVERGPSFSYPFAPPPDLVVGDLGELAAALAD